MKLKQRLEKITWEFILNQMVWWRFQSSALHNFRFSIGFWWSENWIGGWWREMIEERPSGFLFHQICATMVFLRVLWNALAFFCPRPKTIFPRVGIQTHCCWVDQASWSIGSEWNSNCSCFGMWTFTPTSQPTNHFTTWDKTSTKWGPLQWHFRMIYAIESQRQWKGEKASGWLLTQT